MRRRPGVMIAILVGVAVAFSALGWWASSLVKSPAEIAAETAPPAMAPVTAEVERMVLKLAVPTRGVLRHSDQHTIGPINIASNASNQPVITRIPRSVGDSVSEGDVLIEISLRPVFLLQGAFPAFRDLARGVEGEDVTQLQEALGRLGYYEGTPDGVYAASTETAVEQMYQSKGYEPRRDARKRIVVPAAEVAFSSGSGRLITEISYAVGDTIAGDVPLLTLASERLEVVAGLPPGTASRLVAGAPAVVTDAQGTSVAGLIESVADRPTADSGGLVKIVIEVDPADTDSELLILGDVRVAVDVVSTETPVLVVPVSAVYTTADGGTWVQEVADSRVLPPVEVALGLEADGLVEVTPADGGSLRAGESVLVGNAPGS